MDVSSVMFNFGEGLSIIHLREEPTWQRFSTQALVMLQIHATLKFPVIISIVSRALRYDDACFHIQAVPP